MSIEKIYKALESVENGSDLVASLKLHNKKLNDEAADYRVQVKDLDSTKASLESLKSVSEMLTKSGLDAKGITALIQDSKGNEDKNSQLQQNFDILNKKFEQLEQAKIESDNAKAKAIKDKNLATLKSTFEGDLTKYFGAFKGRLMVKDFIDSKTLTLDENGEPVYTDSDGVYGKADAIERIKASFKDELIADASNGANSSQNSTNRQETTNVVENVTDFMTLDPAQLMEQGLKK